MNKVRVDYFNNKLSFQNIPDEENESIKLIWIKLREDYTDWVANFGVNGTVKNKSVLESLEWKGMSTWWFNPLSAKDFEYGKCLNQLMVLYLIKKYEKNIEIYLDDKVLLKTISINFPNVFVDLNIVNKDIKSKHINIVSLVKSVIRVFSTLALTRRFKKNQDAKYKDIISSIWFVSPYPANWIELDGQKQDRHFSRAIDLDRDYDEYAKYFIYIFKYAKDRKLSFIQLYKDLSNFNKWIDREVVFAESNINIKDIFNVYYSSLKEWMNFEKWVKDDDFNKLFFINKMDLSILLQNVWREGFFGDIQYRKLHGLAIGNFLGKLNNPQTIVTYGDFFAEYRGDYFFGTSNSKDSKFVSVQHSRLGRNYGPAYNRKIEFSHEKDTKYLCPSPNLYCAQGAQYKNILSSFFPIEKIKIIGSLRHIAPVSFDKYKEDLIIIAIGSSDVDILVSFLKEVIIEKRWKIIVTTHPAIDVLYLKKIINNFQHLNIELNCDVSTMTLLPIARLLICSRSNVAFESTIFNTKPVRIIPIDVFPSCEGDSRILEFSDAIAFSEWFKNNEDNLNDENMPKIVNDYYYKIDGLSSKRLWDFLMSRNELPHNRFNY
jgi:hypothetical protein